MKMFGIFFKSFFRFAKANSTVAFDRIPTIPSNTCTITTVLYEWESLDEAFNEKFDWDEVLASVLADVVAISMWSIFLSGMSHWFLNLFQSWKWCTTRSKVLGCIKTWCVLVSTWAASLLYPLCDATFLRLLCQRVTINTTPLRFYSSTRPLIRIPDAVHGREARTQAASFAELLLISCADCQNVCVRITLYCCHRPLRVSLNNALSAWSPQQPEDNEPLLFVMGLCAFGFHGDESKCTFIILKGFPIVAQKRHPLSWMLGSFVCSFCLVVFLPAQE